MENSEMWLRIEAFLELAALQKAIAYSIVNL